MRQAYIKINNIDEMMRFASWYAMEEGTDLDSFGYPVVEKDAKQYALFSEGGVDPINSLPAIFEVRKSDQTYTEGWFLRHMPMDLINENKDGSFELWKKMAISLDQWLNHTYVKIDNTQDMLDFTDWYAKGKNSYLDSFGYPVANSNGGREDAIDYGEDIHPTNELPAIFKIECHKDKWHVCHKSKQALSVDSNKFGSWVKEAVSLKKSIKKPQE